MIIELLAKPWVDEWQSHFVPQGTLSRFVIHLEVIFEME
jgi:hypothetical protein